MIRIGLAGYHGRMGQAIAGEVQSGKVAVLSSAFVRSEKDVISRDDMLMTTNLDEALANCDVMIEFTTATAVPSIAAAAAKAGKPLVSGTTGLTEDQKQSLITASRQAPILHAPNTSLSLAAMKQITQLAAKLLAGFDYDIAILDEHHRNKLDAPSGTAKALGEAVINGNGGTHVPSYAAIRAGHIVGNHEVLFTGDGETIRLHHSVTDRRIFARGAVQAALWLHNKPVGHYGMNDVLGLRG